MAKVSINIPVYNGQDYISETLESVLNQTYNDFEIIIVNDGSSDNSEGTIKGFKDPRIKYFYQHNQGIGLARNRAIRESSGEYIAFLDQDDLWLPAKLEEEIALFERDPDIGLVFCDTVFFNRNEELFRYYDKKKPPEGRVFGQLLKKYFLSLETVMIRRNVLDKTGLFPDYMMAEEYNLFLRIAYWFAFAYVDKPLAKYRLHEKNYSWGRELDEIDEVRKTLAALCESIPDIKQTYRRHLEEKRDDLDFSEAIALWKNNHSHKAQKIILRLIQRKIKPKTILALLLIYLFDFKTYNKLSGFLAARKKKNPFLWQSTKGKFQGE